MLLSTLVWPAVSPKWLPTDKSDFSQLLWAEGIGLQC